MTLSLTKLTPASGSRTKIRRMGRGPGSGRGKTAGRGTKGQRARSGGRKGLKRLGLKRIMQRIPQHRGFTSQHPHPAVINVGVLEARFPAGTMVTPKALVATGLVRQVKDGVKILGEGIVTKAFVIKDCLLSKSAKEKLEKAGGKLV